MADIEKAEKLKIGMSGQQKRRPTHRQLHLCANKHQKNRVCKPRKNALKHFPLFFQSILSDITSFFHLSSLGL